MDTTSPIASSFAPTPSRSGAADIGQFRNADFLKIMMSELSQQDPFKPQETSAIVDNMQKLQQLANTQFQKFRDDQTWAQDLIGKSVNARQMAITAAQQQAMKQSGLSPDVGYGNVSGNVDSFRVVNQTVYVSIKGHDYPMDNVTQVNPTSGTGGYLASVAGGLLGRQVTYFDPATATSASGKVTAVANKDGKVVLSIGGADVPMEQITKIAVAQ